MKPGLPWETNGSGPAGQDAAPETPRRAVTGMSLSDWLTSVLDEQAQTRQATPASHGGGSIQERMDDISAQLNALSRNDQDTAGTYRDPRPAAVEAQALTDILNRVSGHERQTRDTFDQVSRQLEGLTRKLDQISAQPRQPQQPGEVPGFRVLDQALRKVVDHIEKSERRHEDTVRGLQERIAQLSAGARGDGSPALGTVVARAESRIDDLSRRIERMETGNQFPELVALVEEHFSKLAARIEEVSSSAAMAGEVPMLRSDIAAVRNMLMGLNKELAPVAELQAVIAAMTPLTERVEDLEARIAAAEMTRDDVAGLKDVIFAISDRIEGLKAQEADQQRMRQDFAELASHVASLASQSHVGELERQVSILAQHFAEEQSGPRADQAQITAIETRLDQLTEALSAVLAQPGAVDSELASAVRDQIERTEARLAAVETRLEHFGVIERAISTLQASLAGMRDDIHAIRTMPGSAEGSAELEAMRAALAALQNQAEQADQNSRQTMGAVHDTLEHIVRKLGELEAAVQPGQAPFAQPPHAPSPYSTSLAEPYAPEPTLLPQAPDSFARPAVDDYIAAARNAARAHETPKAPKSARFSGLKLEGKRRTLVAAGLLVLLAVAAFSIGKPLLTASEPPPPQAAAQPAEPAQQQAEVPAPAASPAAASFDLPATITPEPLRQAAIKADPAALVVVANRMLAAGPASQDAALIVAMLEKAAATLVPAQYRLGTMYESGTAVAKDYAKAREWYARAAEGGNVKAMHNLAVLSAKAGEGSEPDYATAVAWSTKAAQHGVRDSMFNLAVLKERGLGTKADPVEAYFWYSAVAKLGDKEAGQKAAEIRKTLPKDAAAAADAKLKGWTPDAPDRTANQITAPAEWELPAGPAQTESTGSAAGPLSANQIAAAQFMLKRLGLYTGTADGKMSNGLADAVRVFQMKNGMTVNGRLSGEVVSKLKAITAS